MLLINLDDLSWICSFAWEFDCLFDFGTTFHSYYMRTSLSRTFIFVHSQIRALPFRILSLDLEPPADDSICWDSMSQNSLNSASLDRLTKDACSRILEISAMRLHPYGCFVFLWVRFCSDVWPILRRWCAFLLQFLSHSVMWFGHSHPSQTTPFFLAPLSEIPKVPATVKKHSNSSSLLLRWTNSDPTVSAIPCRQLGIVRVHHHDATIDQLAWFWSESQCIRKQKAGG